MKFVVDLPLGGLAKWLRLGGFDATVQALSAGGLGLPSPAPGTYLLTRQAALAGLRREDVLMLRANDPENQLAEVFRRLRLTRRDLKPLSRCGECNQPLAPVPRDAALGLVPDHVFHTQAEFYRCPQCGRLYWPGSHPARITARLNELFQDRKGRRAAPPSPPKGASHGV